MIWNKKTAFCGLFVAFSQKNWWIHPQSECPLDILGCGLLHVFCQSERKRPKCRRNKTNGIDQQFKSFNQQ